MNNSDIKIGELYRIISMAQDSNINSFSILEITAKKNDLKTKTTAESVIVLTNNAEIEQEAKKLMQFPVPQLTKYKKSQGPTGTVTATVMPGRAKFHNHKFGNKGGPFCLSKPFLIINIVPGSLRADNETFFIDIAMDDKIWRKIPYDPANCKWELKQVTNVSDLCDKQSNLL